MARRSEQLMFEVVTWNMNHWQRTAEQRADTWRYLDEILRPDVSLLQECVPPALESSRCVYRRGGISATRPWGSAVISRDHDIVEITDARSCYHGSPSNLVRTHPGTMVVADIQLAEAGPITVVSMYGLIEESYAITTLHHLLSDLTPLFDSDRGGRIVLGGDLNCSTQLGDAGYRDRYRNLFDRIRAFGLVDLLELRSADRTPPDSCPCDDAQGCRHVQTYRHPRSTRPWHNDYLFASSDLAELVIDCDVIAGDHMWQLSDHLPVRARFES